MRAASLLLVLLAAACSAGSAPPAPVAPPPTPPPAPSGESTATSSTPSTTEAQLRFALTDESDFTVKPPPKPGEWLSMHEERSETLEQYRAEDPVRVTAERSVLCFVPVGEFGEQQRHHMDTAIEFAAIWFDLPTRTLEQAPLPDESFSRDRGSWRQYQTDAFLKGLLPRRLPDDAVCLIGVTMVDLYPGPDWNFVFGMATFFRRVGVYSLARYYDSFQGGVDDEASLKRAKIRTCTVVVHEAGHAFTLAHCIDHMCVMNGSNSMAETDSQPLHLCPGCLQKLHWNRGFDVLERYRRLLAFYEKHEFEDEADWVRTRLARIESAR